MPNEEYKVEYIYGAQSLKSFDKMLQQARKTAKSMDDQMKAIVKSYDKASSSNKKMTASLNESNKITGKYRTTSKDVVKTNKSVVSSNNSAANSFKKAAEQNAKSAAALRAQGQKMKSFGGDVMGVGRTMTMFSAAALAAFGGMIKTGKDFETQFTGVVKTVSDGTPAMSASIQNFRNEMLGMLKELPIASEELNSIAEIGGQMGIPINNLKVFTEVVAKLGIATNITGENGAEMIGKFMNIMDIKPTERNMREFGDVIVALGNAMNGTEDDILQLANRLSGAASMINMSQKDTLALASAMAAVGIKAEMGGGAFQRVSIQIQDLVDKGGPKLEKLAAVSNMSADEFVKGWKTKPLETFMAFEKGIRKAGSQGSKVFRSLFKNWTRDLQMTLKLAKGYKQLELARDTANEAALTGGNLTRESSIRFQTLDSKIQLLKNSFTTLSVAVFDKFGDEIKGLVTNFTGFISNITNWVESLDSNSVKVVTAVGLVTASIGPLSLAFGGFLKVAGQVKIIRGTVGGGLDFISKALIKTEKSSKIAGVGTETFLGNLLRIPQAKSKIGTGVTWVKNQFENLGVQMALANGVGESAVALFTSGLPIALGVGGLAIAGIGLAWYLAGEDMRKARDVMGDAADTMVNSWNIASKGSQTLNSSMENIGRTSQNVVKDMTLLSTAIKLGDVNYNDYVNSVNDGNTTLIENSKKVVEQRMQDYKTLIFADTSLTEKQKANLISRQAKVYDKDAANLEKIRVAWVNAYNSGSQKEMIKVSQRLNKELGKQGMLSKTSTDDFVRQAKNMRAQGMLTTETQKKMYKEASQAINASLAEARSAYQDTMKDENATQKQRDQALKSMVSATKTAYNDMGKIISTANGADLTPYMKNLKNGLIEVPLGAPKNLKKAIDEMNAYLEKMPKDQKPFLDKTVNNWEEVIKNGTTTWKLAGKNVTVALTQGIKDGFGRNIEEMRNLVNELGLVFDENQNEFVYKGHAISAGIFKGIDKGMKIDQLRQTMDAVISSITNSLDEKNGHFFYKGYDVGDKLFKGIDWGLPKAKLDALLQERIRSANNVSLTEAQKNQSGKQIAENITSQIKEGSYAEAMNTAKRLLKFSQETGSNQGIKVANNIIKKLKAGNYQGAMNLINKELTLPKNAGSWQGANWGNNFVTNLPKAVQDILAGKTPGKGAIPERNYGKNFALESAKLAQDIANRIIVNNAQPRPEYNQVINVQTRDVTTASSLTKIKQRGAFLQ